MSQLEKKWKPTRRLGGAGFFFLRRLEAERLQENGWQEPYEARGSRTVLRGTGGEIPPVYPTQSLAHTPMIAIKAVQVFTFVKIRWYICMWEMEAAISVSL